MKKCFVFFSLVLLLTACGGSKSGVVYRFEQNDPNRHNTIGITNVGGSTQAYGSIGISAHTGN